VIDSHIVESYKVPEIEYHVEGYLLVAGRVFGSLDEGNVKR